MADDETVDTTQDGTVPQEAAPAVEPQAEVRAVGPTDGSSDHVVGEHPVNVFEQNIGTEPAQVLGPRQPTATESNVSETFLAGDRVIIDHADPLATKYQFLGQAGPASLPLGGGNGDARKPEQKLADAVRDAIDKVESKF